MLQFRINLKQKQSYKWQFEILATSLEISLDEVSMSTKNQHYVPRVYLKAWETLVESSKQPTNKFNGVYCFRDNMLQGEGRSKETILWAPHLYTINFKQLYIAKKCPTVYSFFVN